MDDLAAQIQKAIDEGSIQLAKFEAIDTLRDLAGQICGTTDTGKAAELDNNLRDAFFNEILPHLQDRGVELPESLAKWVKLYKQENPNSDYSF